MTSKEALDKLEECAYAMKDLPMSNWIDLANSEAELDLKIMDWVETIKHELFKGKQALLELKQIKKAEPSEAMESLERIDKEYATIENEDFKICFNTIKQTLLKAQELKKENQELKRKYESHDFLYQNEVSKNGNLAGKIFEKDLKIQKLEKAIEVIKNKGIDYHSISAIKQSKDYEDYLDLVKNLITVVFKLTKREYEILKEAL